MSPTAEQARTIEVLREARELISDPERWTRGVLARDAHGRGIDPTQKEAVCWCAIGAVRSAARRPPGTMDSVPATRALENATRASVATVNDRGGHKRMLALFDRAIARLEKVA